MLRLKYIGSKTEYHVNFSKVSAHVVQILGELPFKNKGFYLSRIGKEDAWDYTGYTTLYREVEGGLQFSDDGSVYVEPQKPEPIPEEPYIPTLEEVRAAKKQEIYSAYNADVAAGVDVELSTGKQHFPLQSEDREFLMGKKLELYENDSEMISYQDSNNRCMLLSRNDMQKIITKALTHVNVKTTYRNNLCEWVDGYDIRRIAIENNVTIFTALETVRVLLDVLEEITMGVSTIDAEYGRKGNGMISR